MNDQRTAKEMYRNGCAAIRFLADCALMNGSSWVDVARQVNLSTEQLQLSPKMTRALLDYSWHVAMTIGLLPF